MNIHDFFRSKLFIFCAIVCALALSLVIISSVNSDEISPLTRAVNFAATPLRAAASSVSDFSSAVFGHFAEFDRLKKENTTLKERVANLEEQLRDAASDISENESFRQLLGLKQKNKSFSLVSAEIIAVSTDSWGTSYIINKGTDDAISVSDCVITPSGMFGYVSEVSNTQSVITTVIDAEMQCGAITTRSREAVVAEGDFQLYMQGFLKLSYLKKGADIMVGDTVETSGLGGIFPKGILIGTVENIETESHGISNYAAVRPAVDFNSEKKLFVITDFDIQD